MEKISPADLIPMDIFIQKEPIAIDLVYADANHPRNIFDEAIYHKDARLWAHKDIAAITIGAARLLNREYDWTLELKDCLRTYEAQAKMRVTKIVQDNPDWLEGEFPMLSKPGARAHPRAMAIDVCVLDNQNNEIDMGTPFDDLSDASARNYTGLNDHILKNRKIIENAFLNSATAFNLAILPLPNEWWDFRFTNDITENFTPLHDANLPPQMQMTNQIDNNIPDFNQEHFDKLAQDILYRVNEAL